MISLSRTIRFNSSTTAGETNTVRPVVSAARDVNPLEPTLFADQRVIPVI